jgi:hypothetical protein
VVESDGECQHGLLGYLSFLFLSISRVLRNTRVVFLRNDNSMISQNGEMGRRR